MSVPAEDEVFIRREGRAGRITLNRPRALNALTYDMVLRIWAALNTWARSSDVDLVVLDGSGDRALCAGGDVRSLYDSRTQGSGFARKFWADEYRLNAFISRYPKPFVAIQDGIVMGGGIGLSSHARYRIVTERSTLAMPETAIGLIPDVGGTWLLAHAPGALGAFLGLTGTTMTAADAIHARFSDVLVASQRLPDLKQRLCDPSGGTVETIIAEMKQVAGASPIAAHTAEIDAIFSEVSVAAILQKLAAAGTEWAQKTAGVMQPRSPKAMVLTFAAIENARVMPSLEHALDVEYRLVTRLFEDGEFPEGVRAQIVDKDRSPKWRPPRLQDLPSDLVHAYLAELPAGEELGLGKS